MRLPPIQRSIVASAAALALVACHATVPSRTLESTRLERVRVTLLPPRQVVLHAPSGDSVPVVVRVLEGRVTGIVGDTLDLVLANAREPGGQYVRPATTNFRTRVVADRTARVDVRYIGAWRTIALVGIPVLLIAYLVEGMKGW